MANIPHLFYPRDYWDRVGLSTCIVALVLPILRRVTDDIFNHLLLVCRPRGGHADRQTTIPASVENSILVELHLYGILLQISAHVHNLLCILLGYDGNDILSPCADCYATIS